MAVIPLRSDVKQTIYIDWFTSSWDREKGKAGLDEYAAECYGLKKRAEILEAANDTAHVVDVKAEAPEKYDLPEFEEFKKTGNINCYNLHVLMCDMCRNGWLVAGVYVVNVSW